MIDISTTIGILVSLLFKIDFMPTFTQISFIYFNLPERIICCTCSGTYLTDEGCVRCFAYQEYEGSITIDSRRSINEVVKTGKWPTESEADEIPDISLLRKKRVQIFSKSVFQVM